VRYRYRIKEGYWETEGKGSVVYGVEVTEREQGIVMTVENVFCDRKTAQDFVTLCNRGGLDPIHLSEVLEDVIG